MFITLMYEYMEVHKNNNPKQFVQTLYYCFLFSNIFNSKIMLLFMKNLFFANRKDISHLTAWTKNERVKS